MHQIGGGSFHHNVRQSHPVSGLEVVIVWLIIKAVVPLFESCHTVHQEFIFSPVDSTISVNVSQMFFNISC